MILEIEGPVDPGILEKSFQTLVKRHEALRTRIITYNNEPLQWITPPGEFILEIIDWCDNKNEPGHGNPDDLAIEQVKRPFSLAKDMLIRAVLIQITRTKCILAVAVHHIISDRFSLGILLDELLEYYHT